MDTLNKVTIQIRGMKYPITTKEDPSYVLGLARKLDDSVKELTSGSKAVSINEALVVIAMSYMDAFEKADRTTDNLRGQIADYLEQASKSRAEANEARRELSKLEKKLGTKK